MNLLQSSVLAACSLLTACAPGRYTLAPQYPDTPAKPAASESMTVKAGDSLSRIAKRTYGNANKWRLIYDANRDQLGSPHALKPGMTLLIPGAQAVSGLQRLGRLRVLGSGNVFRNHRRARDGQLVYHGDLVTTGRKSGAIVKFDSGGFVQLKENTGPTFRINRFRDNKDKRQRRSCAEIYIELGEIIVNGKYLCVTTPDLRGLLGSEVYIIVDRADGALFTTMYATEGKFQGPSFTLLAGQRLTSKEGKIGPIEAFSDAELAAISSWRDDYGSVDDVGEPMEPGESEPGAPMEPVDPSELPSESMEPGESEPGWPMVAPPAEDEFVSPEPELGAPIVAPPLDFGPPEPPPDFGE